MIIKNIFDSFCTYLKSNKTYDCSNPNYEKELICEIEYYPTYVSYKEDNINKRGGRIVNRLCMYDIKTGNYNFIKKVLDEKNNRYKLYFTHTKSPMIIRTIDKNIKYNLENIINN